MTELRMNGLERDRQALGTVLSSAIDRTALMMTITELPSGRYLRVNEAFTRATGFSEAEALGKTAIELGLVDGAFRAALDRELRAHGRIEGLEFQIRRKDGERRAMRHWAELIQTPDGPRIFGMAEDATARLELEAARDEALSRLQKLASLVPGVVYQFRRTPDGRDSFPFASPRMREIFDVDAADVRDDAGPVFARVHPDDLARINASIDVSARELSLWQQEFRTLPPDGSVRWLGGSATPEREADGSTLWHGFISNITEWKQSDEALRTSEARFKAAMEATSDGLWDWDLVHARGYFSPGYYRMLGYEPGEVDISVDAWSRFVHPDDLQLAAEATNACIDGRVERFEAQYRMRARNGEWRWMLSRGKCFERDARGVGTRLLGTNTDVTAQRAAQMGLAQSERLASMGMLAAGVAHEINNPLAYVLSNLDLLSEELPHLVELARGGLARGAADAPLTEARLDAVLESARSALEGTRRIRTITRGLGTFARVDRLELEPVDLNAVLETAATMAHNEVRFRATLVKDLGAVPPVRASEGKLAQVFLNLVINSAHAIAEGHVADHRITLRSWADEGGVYAEVEDTGHGIPPEHLEHIFEPFFTTKKVGAGSGLGLAITRNIITDFGGALSVDSEVGKGTRMRVRLPRWVDAATPPRAPRPSHPGPRAPRGRVLVVDDEPAIRKAITRVLSGETEVVTACSGREAKLLLERDRAFDVVLCDLMMPDMTGMELHAWLAEVDPAFAERVVFVSGGAFTPRASEYLERVGNLRLEKPFEHAALRELVRARVKARRAASA